MKKLYATRTLQKNKFYKEIQDNIVKYYELSLEKERKQNSFLKRLNVMNKKTGEFINLKYDFEKKYKENAQSISQRVYTIEQMAKDKGFVPLFLTLTLPSEYHVFQSVEHKKKGQRLFTNQNPAFKFESVTEAVQEGYKHLNHVYTTLYKRIKFFCKKDLMYIRSVEAHSTLLPHFHIVMFVPFELVDAVKGVYNRVIEHFKLKRTDFQEVSFKDNITHASRYILKYITKTLTSNSDFFEARFLSQWKSENSIRIFSTSKLPVNLEVLKKMYYSFTNVEKNKIFSKNKCKLYQLKEIVESKAWANGAPIYYFFIKNLYYEQKFFNENNCSQNVVAVGSVESLFRVKHSIQRNLNKINKLTYTTKKMLIWYRGIKIYEDTKFRIIKII